MKKYRASKLEIKLVPKEEEKQFLNSYHHQGYIASRMAYGLYDNNELLELMSFGVPRFNKNYDYELLRLCTKKDVEVYGGASKLFQKRPEGSIVSYCNRDLFDGKVYQVLGFESQGITKGYKYIKGDKSLSRQKCQRYRLAKLFNKEEYNDRAKWTEKSIMANEGYEKVYDKIGQERFVFNDKAIFYVYKLEFEDGSTYIGSHIQRDENDGYITSSHYIDVSRIVNRTIIGYYPTMLEMYKAEHDEIIKDKLNSSKNVNGNYGGHTLDYSKLHLFRKHYEASEETRRKLSEAHKGLAPWNKGKKGVQTAWNKGMKGIYTTTKKGKTMPKLSEAHKAAISKGSKGLKWWNNGITNTKAKECPGEGWMHGRLI